MKQSDIEIGPFRFVGWHWQFEWKPRDLWVGAYWKRIAGRLQGFLEETDDV